MRAIPEAGEADRAVRGEATMNGRSFDVFHADLATGEYIRSLADGVSFKKRCDIVVGLPASGKSTSIAEVLTKKHKSMLIDSNRIKPRLLPADGCAGGTGGNATQEESACIVAELFQRQAMEDGANIVMAKPGEGIEAMDAINSRLEKHGYEIHYHLMDITEEEAMKRALARYMHQKPGKVEQYVDPTLIEGKRDMIEGVFSKVTSSGKVKSWAKWSNMVPQGSPPELVSMSENYADAAAIIKAALKRQKKEGCMPNQRRRLSIIDAWDGSIPEDGPHYEAGMDPDDWLDEFIVKVVVPNMRADRERSEAEQKRKEALDDGREAGGDYLGQKWKAGEKKRKAGEKARDGEGKEKAADDARG